MLFVLIRLKDVLDRQKMAQCQRQKMLSLKDGNHSVSKMEQLIAFLEREYDVMTSLVDAELTLDQLMEDRSIISLRIAELNRSQKELPSPPDSSSSTVEQELINLREELELRNAQIFDMQQKIYVTDLETYISSVGDNIHNMMEARIAMKHLWKSILDIRRDKTQSLEELKTQLTTTEEKCHELNRNIDNLKKTHEHVIREYEEKIAVILSSSEQNVDCSSKLMGEVERCSRLHEKNSPNSVHRDITTITHKVREIDNY